MDVRTCTCEPDLGGGPCRDCMAAAHELVESRALVRDSYGREWHVEDVDSKNGLATVGGAAFWAYLDDVAVIESTPARYVVGLVFELRTRAGESPDAAWERLGQQYPDALFASPPLVAERRMIDDPDYDVAVSYSGRQLDAVPATEGLV